MRYPAHRVLPPEERGGGLRAQPIVNLIMNEQHKIEGTVPAVRAVPCVPLIRNVNWAVMRALYMKEVRRFFKVQLQTIWAPAITTLLFLIIFTVALGRGGHMVLGVPFADFIAPGLIIMGMMQNSFANSSFSLLVGKIQGTLVDYLMPPISVGELMAALIGASITRAICVGFTVWLAMLIWPDVHVAGSEEHTSELQALM